MREYALTFVIAAAVTYLLVPLVRKFAIAIFTMFILLWAVLVIIGSFFRGPGFNFVFPWNDGIFTLAPDPWKGALNPSPGSPAAMPVGVQNP